MPIAICENGHEVSWRNQRGVRLADMRCPEKGCGKPLHSRGKGAARRGRCVVCTRLCESTVPDLGHPLEAYGYLDLRPSREKLRDVVPGEHLCWRHQLRGTCGCDARLSWRDREGAFLPRRLYQGVEPCPVHGGEPVGRLGQP